MQTTLPEQDIIAAAGLRTSFHRPELDALRFLAFFAVFCFHASFLRPNRGWLWDSIVSSGSFGMSLFFVLSAFLITTLLMKERTKTGTVNILFFYARRILRIWPLYLVFLLSIWWIGHYVAELRFPNRALLSFLLLSGNWYLIFVPLNHPAMPLWSISLEEQFYLLWPGLFRGTRPKTFAVIAAGLVPLSLLSIYVLHSFDSRHWYIWWNTLSQMMFFGIGGLLALYGDTIFKASTLPRRMAAASLALTVWVAGGFAMQHSLQHSGLWLVLSYSCSAVGCVLFFQAVWRASHVPRFLLYLGKISYGLYVFHSLSFLLAFWMLGWLRVSQDYRLQIVVGFVITVVMAGISYPALEKPFLRLKRHFEIIPSR